VTPALGKRSEEDPEFKATLDYKVRPCFKKEKKKQESLFLTTAPNKRDSN
jgi:hypothetical protein